jgi:hypothetical protein
VGSVSANSYFRIHIRYGGYGGIGYYLVSDNYIALMSRFTTCGSWEGHYILDFLLDHVQLTPVKLGFCASEFFRRLASVYATSSGWKQPWTFSAS